MNLLKLFVQGTKYGYNILFPKPTPTEFFQFAYDIRRIDSNSGNLFGKDFYSIAFASSGRIFTKYVLVYDVQRGWLGNIGLSVHIPNNQKMASADIKAMLDELANTYCQKYCPNFYLDMVYEDWTLFTSIVANYESKLKHVSSDDAENLQSGTQEAAFVYYSSDTELQKYFDAPFQEEYTTYRQILFISSELQNKPESPLNALRHSDNDLTGKIDLENPKYKLLFKRQEIGGLNIEVRINGKERSSGNKIRKKNILTINYYQKFRKPLSVEGTWEDIKRDYPRSIEIDNEKETITINPVQLQPERITIPITVIDEASKRPIHDFQVICKGSSYNQSPKEAKNNQIVFEGDEIGDNWYVEARAYEYKEEGAKIIPEKTTNVTFELKEQRIFIIAVIDKKNNETLFPNEYELKVFDNKKQTPQYYIKNEKNKIVFVGNEIEREWHIEIKKNGYEVFDEKVKIYPRNEDTKHPIEIYVEKKHQTTVNDNYRNYDNIYSTREFNFSFTAGKNGTVINDSFLYGPYRNYSDYNKAAKQADIKPNFGYKLDELKEKSSNGNNYNFEAQFKPIIPLKWVLIILLGIIAGLGISLYFVFKGDNQPHIVNKNQIIQYVEGDTLFLNTLNSYKTDWGKQKPKIEGTGGGILGLWGDNEDQKNSTKYEEWDNVNQSIEEAIRKRNLINNVNFAELKKQNYFAPQLIFKNTISTIDPSNYEDIKKQLGDVSKLTLTEIAESINNILKPTVSKVEETSIEVELETTLSVSGNDGGSVENIIFSASKGFKTIIVTITNANYYQIEDLPSWCSITDENKTSFKLNREANNTGEDRNGIFKVKANGKEVTINVSQAKATQAVQDQANDQSSAQRQQEKFQQDFWELVKKKGKPQKADYDKWFSSGSRISYKNEYKIFYNEYLNTTFSTYGEISESDRIKAKTLNDLEKLINKLKQ